MHAYPAFLKTLWLSEEYVSCSLVWSRAIISPSGDLISTLIIIHLSLLPHLLYFIQDGLQPIPILTLDPRELLHDLSWEPGPQLYVRG